MLLLLRPNRLMPALMMAQTKRRARRNTNIDITQHTTHIAKPTQHNTATSTHGLAAKQRDATPDTYAWRTMRSSAVKRRVMCWDEMKCDVM